MKKSKFLHVILNNYLFVSLLTLEIIFCSLFNFRSNTQSGLIQTYLQYANFIRSGFNFSVEPYLYTFPMWGYGFILSITKSKVLIIILQQLLAFGVVLFIDTSLLKLNWRISSKILFRFSALTALPWFFFHTVIWPYSLGANLLMLGILSLFCYLDSQKIIWLVLSSLSFGLMLNFRSDYLYFVVFLAVLIPTLQWTKYGSIKIIHIIVWIGLIFLLLLPWSQYSKLKSGHRLFKTTNKGHFLFISLGQLPNNPWNITPLDKDSIMLQLVMDNLGQKNTMDYRADTFLTKEWLNLIKDNPKGFAKKCLANFSKLNESPFYEGELWIHKTSVWEDSLMQTSLDRQARNFSDQLNIKTNENRMVFKILRFEYYLGRMITIFFYLSLIFSLIKFRIVFYKDNISIIILSLIAYQAAIAVLTFYTRQHHTNLYLIYILWIIYVFNEKRPIEIEWVKKYALKYLGWIPYLKRAPKFPRM